MGSRCGGGQLWLSSSPLRVDYHTDDKRWGGAECGGERNTSVVGGSIIMMGENNQGYVLSGGMVRGRSYDV